jgi:hypothetical protein
MTGLHSRLPDPVRSRLRAAVAGVDSALSHLPAAAKEADAPGGLEEAWRELVELLALGPEPAYRDCPVCGATGMRDATVCGYCWTKLAPLEVTALAAASSPRAEVPHELAHEC